MIIAHTLLAAALSLILACSRSSESLNRRLCEPVGRRTWLIGRVERNLT